MDEQGWGVYSFEDREPPEAHVVPEVDRDAHEPLTTCGCRPRVESVPPYGSLVVVHADAPIQ